MSNEEHDEWVRFIAPRAEAAGRSWAAAIRAAIHREKRRASGGWPGTMTEARHRASNQLLHHQEFERYGVVSAQSREVAARMVYAAARSAWLQCRDPDDDV